MAKAEIVQIRETMSPRPERMGRMDMEIAYKIDGMGPYMVYVPSDSYTPAEGLKAVQAKAAEWAAVVGKVVEAK